MQFSDPYPDKLKLFPIGNKIKAYIRFKYDVKPNYVTIFGNGTAKGC